MSRYKPESVPHAVLRYLAQAGPSRRCDLFPLVPGPGPHRRRRKVLDYVLRALGDDGFTTRIATVGVFTVTPAGLGALACLDAGHAVDSPAAPRARFFARAA